MLIYNSHTSSPIFCWERERERETSLFPARAYSRAENVSFRDVARSLEIPRSFIPVSGGVVSPLFRSRYVGKVLVRIGLVRSDSSSRSSASPTSSSPTSSPGLASTSSYRARLRALPLESSSASPASFSSASAPLPYSPPISPPLFPLVRTRFHHPVARRSVLHRYMREVVATARVVSSADAGETCHYSRWFVDHRRNFRTRREYIRSQVSRNGEYTIPRDHTGALCRVAARVYVRSHSQI